MLDTLSDYLVGVCFGTVCYDITHDIWIFGGNGEEEFICLLMFVGVFCSLFVACLGCFLESSHQ